MQPGQGFGDTGLPRFPLFGLYCLCWRVLYFVAEGVAGCLWLGSGSDGFVVLCWEVLLLLVLRGLYDVTFCRCCFSWFLLDGFWRSLG